MTSKLKITILHLLISLLPLAYLLMIWNELPSSVPLHYNMNNQPDRMGSKNELFGVMLFLSAVGFGVPLLLRYLHKIDPKQRVQDNSALMMKVAWTTVIFISLIGIFIVYQTLAFTKGSISQFSGKGILLLICLVIIVLGNFMNNVKPNYFVGIRTPWNLEDEENWRKTHHLGSKLMFFGGIILAVLVLLLPEPFSDYTFMGGLIPIVLIPFVYSFLLFKNKK